MLDFLIRGLLMDEAGDAGGGGLAVADATGDFDAGPGATAEDQTDGQVHDAEFIEPSTETTHEPGAALVKAGERAVVNGKFTQSGKAAIEALKPLSPRLAQEVTQALLTRDYFLQQFPGGKKEVQQLRTLAQTHGGEQGISELRSIADQMEEIDSLYARSDPAFIDKITEDEEGQRAFVGLMAPALAKFAKLAPDQFAYHNAKNFVHLMDSARLPVICARVADLLSRADSYQKSGNHEMAASLLVEISSAYNEIADTLNKPYALAAKPPAGPAAADPKMDDRAKQLTAREQAIQKQEWEGSVSSERRRIFARSWAEQTKGRTLTADQESNVKGFYELRMTAKIRQWTSQAARFFANGDKDGYLREQFSFFQKAIPDALRQAILQAVPAKPGPKPTAAGGPLRPPVARGTSTNGAVKVAKMPPTSQLDPVRTTSAMLSENKAYTKDGKLVQWV